MKKVLSILLTFSMIIPTMIFATVSASGTTTDSSIYTTVENLSYSAIGFLSAEKAGTYTDENGTDLNFFGKWSQTKPLAISKESFEKLPHDENGIYTINGTPYKVNTTDGEKTVGYSQGWTNITKQNYSKIKVLVAFPDVTGWGDINNTIYFYFKYDDASTNTNGKDTEVGKDMNQSGGTIVANGEVDWAIVKKDDTVPSNKVNLREFTFNLDTTKKLKGYCLVPAGNAATPARVLAITTVGLTGSEWNPIIEEKLASFSVDDVKNYDKTAYAEIDELITRAKNEGSDVSAIDGIEKYNKIKTYLKTVSEAYTTVDISSQLTNKLYANQSDIASITDPKAPDYFLPISNPNNYTLESYAVDLDDMNSKLTDGIFTYDGVPFKVDTTKGGVLRGDFSFTSGYYSEVKILAISGPKSYGNNEYYSSVYSGSSTVAVTTSGAYPTGIGTTVKVRKIATDTESQTESNATLNVYTLKVNDKTQKINKVGIWALDENNYRILAVTTVGLVGDDYIPFITEKLSALPDKFADLDITSFNELADMIEKAKAGGADVSNIEGIDKYNAFKEIIDGSYTTTNLTGNAIGFLSKEKAGTYTEDTGANLNFFGKWTQPRTLAISKESFEKLPHDENGVYTFNGTPYKINTADGEKTVAQSGGSTIGQKRYSQIKVLAAFPDVSSWDKTPNHALYFIVKYSDGKETLNLMKCDEGTVVAKDIDWVAVKTGDTAPTDKAQIREYTIPVDATKNVTGYGIWYPENGITNTPGRIIAFTTVDAISDNWTKDTSDILLENVTLRNSSRTAVDKVSDITDGKLTFTADVSNYKYKDGKALNIITAVYNDGVLYDVKITPVTVAYNTMYGLNVTMEIPKEGLNEKWTTSTFVWDSDVVTPITANVVK